MLKYYNVISQMTEKEKIEFLCDPMAISDRRCRELGFAKPKTEDMKKAFESRYLALSALANSFDTDIAEKMCDRVFGEISASKSNLALIPGPKAKLNPFRESISEDTFLTTAFVRAFLRSSERNGIKSALTGYGMNVEDIEWADKTPDERFMREYIEYPFEQVSKDTSCGIYISETEPRSEAYRGVSLKYADIAEENGKKCISRSVLAESSARYVEKEKLFLGGTQSTLENALMRYRQLRSAIEHGRATTEMLSAECESGKAVSEEKLNIAVNSMIDFFSSCVSGNPYDAKRDDSELLMRAVLESAVLLKNKENILPLKPQKSVCILGDIALREREGASFEAEVSAYLTEKGFEYLGSARGYDVESGTDISEIDSAAELAESADTVIVFLGYSEKEKNSIALKKKFTVSVSQQALLDRLEEQKKKTVVIIPAEICPDIVIEENCAAILALPYETKYSAEALCRLLTGEESPCGKLANTVYVNQRELYKTHLRHRNLEGIKRGTFFGYRYYDTAGEEIKYPFGHGLSYTKFKYSSLKLEDGKATFTVKNIGKRAGTEIAQIYIGMENSKVIRPVKELCGAARIPLAAGESKTVSVAFEIPKVYDEADMKMKAEKGKYTIYVASSVKDVRLSGTIEAGEEELNCEKCEELSDYIQSETNIFKDNFKLEAKIGAMKRSLLNIVAGAGAVCLGICLKLYCVLFDLESGFFDIFSLILAAAGMFFFVMDAINKNHSDVEKRTELNEKSEEMFDKAEQISVYAADKMFLTQFNGHEEEDEEETEAFEETDELIEKYVDKDLTFEEAVKDFVKYALERGYIFRIDNVRSIFSSLAASRLIITDGIESERFKEFMTVLSGYFGSETCIDRVNMSYNSADSLFFQNNSEGLRERTQMRVAFASATNNPQNIQLAALDGVEFSALPSYFAPFAEYIKSPLEQHTISAYTIQMDATSYMVPKNLWLVLNVSETERLNAISDFAAELGSVITVYFEKCQPREQTWDYRQFSYYQLEYLTEKALAGSAFEEENWKKIDKLEEYVKARVPYAVGNRQWLVIEKFVFTYLALGGEETDALDAAVSARLIPQILSVLKDKLGYEDKTLIESVEEIFGEEHTESCKRIIRISESKKAE